MSVRRIGAGDRDLRTVEEHRVARAEAEGPIIGETWTRWR